MSVSKDFPDLPQAASEMTGIEKYFPVPRRAVFSREQATAGAYLASRPGQFSFVQFVAHGTASRTSPLDSVIILSKQEGSYKLYARDIVKQPLRASLVTISVCHGASERMYSSEGLVGLTWAFLHAGAHGVIAMLWEVNDNSTPQLMDQLYAGITGGKPPDTALRDAKLALVLFTGSRSTGLRFRFIKACGTVVRMFRKMLSLRSESPGRREQARTIEGRRSPSSIQKGVTSPSGICGEYLARTLLQRSPPYPSPLEFPRRS